jgi:hypothetical protein
MRTIEKLTKKASRSLVIFVAFIFLFGLAAEAQKTMKTENYNQLSYIFNMEKDKIVTIIFSPAANNEILEKDIEFENWMADLNEWAGKSDSGSYEASEMNEAPAMDEQFEQDMDFESWMFEKDLTKEEAILTEDSLKFETWMYTPSNWTVTSR